ncbi:glycoside hydrolase family 3 N-terminal domain-containing protein [Thermodesulfobacteriota bacterium]
MTTPIYKDPTKSTNERVKDLLDKMNLEEKILQLTSIWLAFDPEKGEMAPSIMGEDLDENAGKVDIDYYLKAGLGQITRAFGSRPVDPVAGAKTVNRIQKRLIEESRLGIPVICHEECLSGLMAQGATSFPSPVNYGSTWEPELIQQVGDVIRRQMRSLGTHQGLAPVCDVARDARWGRVEETIGEDPYLVGIMVTSYVKGLQGDDIKKGIIATLKHFAGYSFSEGGRNFAPVHVGKRDLMDVFFVPFEMAVKEGKVLSLMNGYHEFDGEVPGASHWLLTEVLRNKWGFDGFTVSDYGSITFLQNMHKIVATQKEAAAAALKAGLDIELPNPTMYPQGLKDALDDGLITEADINLAVTRILKLKFKLGLFEEPYVDTGAIRLDLPEEKALAAKIAEKSITLLSNNGALPIKPGVDRIALIGPNAHNIMALFGNYSFENHVVSTHYKDMAEEVVSAPTVLERLKEKIGDEKVIYAQGCNILDNDLSMIPGAVEAAQKSDIAVLVVGDKAGHFRAGTVGEGTDTPDLSLPGGQEELVNAIFETGKPVVIVLLNGRPFAMPKISEKASAIVEAWFPGQEGAGIIIDTLFGDLNPGGKTTLTFSQSAGVQPLFYNHKFLAPGFPELPEFEPVFPFGHGLSYTEFSYSDLNFSSTEVAVDGKIEISFILKNSGDSKGEEVVQLYINDPVASIPRPVKELKGFKRIPLEPGERKKVTFTMSADMLAFTGLDYKKIIEPGEIKIMIGSSSEDIRLEDSFILTGETLYPGEDRKLLTDVRVV